MPGPIEPSLKFGLVCEKVLREQDNVLSFIRVVDRFSITIAGEAPPEELPAGKVSLTIVMGWVGGLGRHEAAFNITRPDGEVQKSRQTWSFTLEALHKGHTIMTTHVTDIPQSGVYWIEFLLNGEVKGRTPFQVVYERQQLR